MKSRRQTILELGSFLLIGFVVVGQDLRHEASEAFTKVVSIMRQEKWWDTHHKEVRELVTKAGFKDSVITEKAITYFSNSIDPKQKAIGQIDVYPDAIIHFRTNKPLTTYKTIDKAVADIYGIKPL